MVNLPLQTSWKKYSLSFITTTQYTPKVNHSQNMAPIFAKNQLERDKHYNTNTLEATTAYDPAKSVHIVCVYRFLSSSIPQFVEDPKLIPATRTDENKVIMGDFNINIQGKNQQTIANICSDLKSNSL